MKRSLLIWILFIVVLTAHLLHAAESVKPSGQTTVLQEILILNSYHPGYAWSDEEQAGIIDTFQEKDKNWVPVIEYLDLRHLPDGRHLAELKRLFSIKYQNKKFPVVIAMDNPALEFAVNNQAELFGNTPIVFCGINNYTPSLLKGRSEVTGIVEAIDIAGTIEVMLRLHPATHEIFSPQDYTATGLAVHKELEALVPRFAKVRFRFTDPLTMEELLKEVERLPKNSLVLAVGFVTDESGRTFNISETTKFFYEHSPVPIYSVYEQQLGFGIVGGKLLSARIHGAVAGQIALRVLTGEKASAIPVVFKSDSQFMFDYKVMSRFGIPLSALPEGSTVINKPVSFYAAHRVVIQTALGIIVFLLIVIFLLAVIITQRKRAEYKLSEAEKHYRMLFNAIDEGFCIVEVIFDENEKPIDYRFLEVNPSFEKQTGLIDARGKRMRELAPKHEEHWFEIYGKIAVTGESARFVNRAEQLHRWYDVYAFRVGQPENRQVAILFNDITERKRIEEALRESQAFYHSLVEQLPAGVFRKDREGRYVFVSPWFCQLKGMKEEEFLGKTPQEVAASEAVKPDATEQAIKYAAGGADHHVQIMQTGNPIELVEEYTGAAGRKQFVHAIKIPVFNSEGKVIGTQGILFDITELKLAEEALESERTLLRNLIDNVPDRIYAKDSEGRFIICNEAMIRRMGKTSMTEIVGKSDFDLLPLEMAQRFHADEQAIIQSGIPMINREEPLTTEGGKITRWNLATKVPLLDKQGNRIGIVGVGREITDLKLAEQKLQATLESLRKAVGVTIQVMASAVERRDPYTSGHQTRSAGLARAIATEMGLPQDKIEGIRMASSIHDIGKLSIPAEILSKPTKLSALELSLIKEHARQGYEILKGVESPWPLAEIVHQHHERMDGSGYPRNLKGEEILIEARILTVADVVEAMASHRPYRPGLGINAALDEIEKNRGILYDAVVADACLRLFREKGFKLERT